MNNPGQFAIQLSGNDLTISIAQTITSDILKNLEGVQALSLEVKLAYGSGGTKIQHYLQTTFDQGTTWVDIACVTFLTAGGTKLVNLSGLTPVTTSYTPTDGLLTDDTCKDGLLGPWYRTKTVSTGTYAGGTALATRVVAR